MRIGIFTESYQPIVNGVSVATCTLRDELIRRGHEVFVFAPRFGGYSDNRDDVFRFPSHHSILMRDYPIPIPYAPDLFRTFESLKLDVVHTQTPFLLGLTGAKWARRCGIPLVSTNHTLYTEYVHYFPVRPKWISRQFMIWLMRWYYSGCDGVVVPSGPVEKRLRSYGVRTRVQVIKTGVVGAAPLDAEGRESVRARFGVGRDGALLLYVGRIAREKNLVMLLRAFEKTTREHPDARLVLVGGGPALAETKRFAEGLGLGDKLQFTGMLSRAEIDPIYGAADVFVFPSTTETQGIAICEALSAGLPVVAVDAGGIPENVEPERDGFLTKDDPDEFAERIGLLISDPIRRAEMGRRARENAACFSIERMVSDFEQFYSSVMAGGPSVEAGPPA